MLSRYKFHGPIGSGGIGVVHAAEDQTLKRKVAIKFLSEESFEKESSRARFHREARLAAALNHPNICTVHEIGEAAAGEEMILDGNPRVQPGTPFIVMELIEGESIDEVVKRGGPMALPKLLDVALQIANGLATPSGRVKILDFGMAKPLVPAAQDDDVMKTTEATSIELTRDGMVLGTVAYMSPEQAGGHPVDARSDVFSFGVLLYEMATGKKPFEGDSMTSTLAKILETEPGPITDSREDLPPEFVRILHRCLRKDREDRYHDTRDLAVTLKDLMHETSSGAVPRVVSSAPVKPPSSARPGYRMASWAVTGAAVIVTALAIATMGPKLFRPAARFVPPSFQQLTFSGSASYPTVSPDGQSLAYATNRPGGGTQIVIQDLLGGQQLPIFEAAWIRSLRWSPKGTELLVSGSSTDDVTQTYLVSRLGGATRPLRYLPFVAWAPDGNSFAGATLSGKQVWFTETSTGTMTSIELTGEFSYIYEIDWSPNGQVLAIRVSDEQNRHAIRTTSVDGSKQQTLVEGKTALYSPRFSSAGDAIYFLSGDEQAKELQKIAIDAQTGEPDDSPVVLLSGLQVGAQMAFSNDGRRLFYAREVSHTNLWLVNVQPDGGGLSTNQLTHGTFRDDAPRFSPDGTRMALIRKSRGDPNIFIMSLAERRPEQLTFLTAEIWSPVWSADGSEIAFGSTMGDAPKIWKIGARGGTPQPFNNSQPSRDLTWAPGSRILYQRPGNSAFHFLDPDGGDETLFMGDSGDGAADPLQFFSWMAAPAYSPSGRQVAISCNCPEGEGIWVVAANDTSRTLIHDDSEILPLGWSADGDWVFAFDPEARSILRLASRGGTAELLATIPFERVGGVDVTPDGTTIAASVPVSQGDIWLIENFDPELD
jgi:serine/threonine protein kinase